MKIALISGVFFPLPGGAQVQTHNLANTLVKNGHDVDVFILNKTNIKNNLYNVILINKFIISFFFYLDLYLNINFTVFFKLYIKSLINKKKYDVCHFQLLNLKTIYILNTFKILKQKIAVTFHGIDIQIDKKINYGYRLSKIYEKKLNVAIQNTNIFFAISKTIYNDLIDYGIGKEKIVTIPNSVAIKKFAEFENDFSGKKEKIKLITVARFAKNKKGLDLIPEISKIFYDKKINFEWSLVGYNSKKIRDFHGMKKFDKNFKYFDNVENLEEEIFPHSNLIKIFKKNHLYINLSRIESFGVTLIESLASGLPVITFDTKGGNELISNNYNGIVLKNFCAKDVVDAVINYQKNEDLFNSHQKNTLQSIDQFDLTKTTKKTLEIYQKLALKN